MLVFGGVGAQAIFGDLHACRLADPDTFYAVGSGAHASYTLESVGEGGGRGLSGRRRRRRVVWEAVELAEGEVPEPRCVVGLCGVFGWVVDRLVD